MVGRYVLPLLMKHSTVMHSFINENKLSNNQHHKTFLI